MSDKLINRLTLKGRRESDKGLGDRSYLKLAPVYGVGAVTIPSSMLSECRMLQKVLMRYLF
jgi:hypothetical protein